MVHGGPLTTRQFCDAIQKGQPIFIFKYTGSTADLVCETLTKVESFLQKKRMNPRARPDPPFKTNLPSNYSHPRWLNPFEEDYEIRICKMLNILIENFPDRYNPASVLQIDMFNTSEEKLQDQLTKTMSVVFEGMVELGGASGENRRLTYAWRLRHLLSYNAARQALIADVLEFLVIIFTFLSVVVAVMYTYATTIDACDSNVQATCNLSADFRTVLNHLNLIFPLAATVFRGMFASLNPLAKWAVLKVGAVKVEGEIYMYRTKVGKYNPRKVSAAPQSTGVNSSAGASSKDNKKDKDDVVLVSTNPRKTFSQALDAIWVDLAASDISKGALVNPPEDSDPLDEVNWRIRNTKGSRRFFTDALKSHTLRKDEIRGMGEKGKGDSSMFTKWGGGSGNAGGSGDESGTDDKISNPMTVQLKTFTGGRRRANSGDSNDDGRGGDDSRSNHSGDNDNMSEAGGTACTHTILN